MIGAIVAGATSTVIATTPPITANLYARYDASVASSITSSATKVSQWNDLSGNGKHLTQATSGYQPVTGTTTQNGRNVIVFDQQVMSSTAVSFTANALTVFFTATKSSAGSAANQYSRVVSFSLNSDNDYDNTNGMNPMYFTSPTSSYNRNNATVCSTALTYGQINTTAFKLNGSAVDLWHNSLTASGTTSATAINSNRFAVGGTYTAVGNGFLNGWVGEILVYTTAMGTSDINLTRDYLKTKWATA
jgi:hypothetical protein